MEELNELIKQADPQIVDYIKAQRDEIRRLQSRIAKLVVQNESLKAQATALETELASKAPTTQINIGINRPESVPD